MISITLRTEAIVLVPLSSERRAGLKPHQNSERPLKRGPIPLSQELIDLLEVFRSRNLLCLMMASKLSPSAQIQLKILDINKNIKSLVFPYELLLSAY